jgi:hypothetical protein
MLHIFHLDVLKVDRGVAYVAAAPVASGEWPAVVLRLLPRAILVRFASPSPLLSLSSLPFPSSRRGSFELDLSGMGSGEGATCVGRRCGSFVQTAASSGAGWVCGEGVACVVVGTECRLSRPNAGVRPDIWALALPYCKHYLVSLSTLET